MAGKSQIVRLVRETKPRRLRMVQWVWLLLLILSALAGAGVAVWWGSIREALMDPGLSFQTYEPPLAPDYARAESWALRPDAQDEAGVDVFFVHPTTYQGRQWNGPFDDSIARRRLAELMLPNYAGPFTEVGRVFAPLYRQASLYTQITLREDARDARAFAYSDVKRAFETYLAADNAGRPFIVVGVEQGALIAGRLVREAVAADPSLKARLAAVYLIDTAEPADLYGPDAALLACEARDQAACVVAYLPTAPGEEGLLRERLRHAPRWVDGRLVPLRDTPILCVNPLLGARTDARAGSELNIGAANASGLEWGEQPGFQAHQVGAQCEDGILQVTRARSAALRGHTSWADSQRTHAYNWFYADLAEDAKARLAALEAS